MLIGRLGTCTVCSKVFALPSTLKKRTLRSRDAVIRTQAVPRVIGWNSRQSIALERAESSRPVSTSRSLMISMDPDEIAVRDFVEPVTRATRPASQERSWESEMLLDID